MALVHSHEPPNARALYAHPDPTPVCLKSPTSPEADIHVRFCAASCLRALNWESRHGTTAANRLPNAPVCNTSIRRGARENVQTTNDREPRTRHERRDVIGRLGMATRPA